MSTHHALELEHGDGALVIAGLQELKEVGDAGRLALRELAVVVAASVAMRGDGGARLRENHRRLLVCQTLQWRFDLMASALRVAAEVGSIPQPLIFSRVAIVGFRVVEGGGKMFNVGCFITFLNVTYYSTSKGIPCSAQKIYLFYL